MLHQVNHPVTDASVTLLSSEMSSIPMCSADAFPTLRNHVPADGKCAEFSSKRTVIHDEEAYQFSKCTSYATKPSITCTCLQASQ